VLTKINQMNKDRRAGRAGFPWLVFGLFILLFSYPVLSLLWRRGYPVFTAEVLLLFLAILALSLALSLITPRVRPAVANLLIGFAVIFTAIIQFNLYIEGLVAGVVVVALAMVLLRERFRSLCIVVLAALLLGAYLDADREAIEKDPEEIAGLAKPELGPVIHILLDGFIGIGGLPDFPASELIREKMLAFFESNGFQLNTHAYSRYSPTGDSVYSAMNFRHDGNSVFTLEHHGRLKHVLKANAVFTQMENLGYRLNVYQTGHLDLCQSNRDRLDRCWQYDHPNVNSLEYSQDTLFSFRALYTVLLQQSRLLSDLQKSLEWRLPEPELPVHDPQVFEELKRDLSTRGRGNYFFAHALLPHGPFSYMPDCTVSFDAPIEYRISIQQNEIELPPIFYELRNGFYFSQVECALHTLQAVLDNLEASSLLDRATIILHGDHGSHIVSKFTMHRNADSFSPEDYRAAYSTLFAVKYPGSEFSIDERVLPLSYLMEELIAVLPAYTLQADTYPAFYPSGDAAPEKVDPYVYFQGKYPQHRVDVDIFRD
jgi:hypothetical protein